MAWNCGKDGHVSFFLKDPGFVQILAAMLPPEEAAKLGCLCDHNFLDTA
jgi:hypothetical protein